MNGDVAFALDASGSIGQDNFERQTEFVRVSQLFDIHICLYFALYV